MSVDRYGHKTPLLLAYAWLGIGVCIAGEEPEEENQGPDPRLKLAIANWRRETAGRLLTHNSGNASAPRHSSVHLNYRIPGSVSGNVSAWYNEVKVTASSAVSYFSVTGHAYGYAGIQQVTKSPFTGRVVFSIWDQLCHGDDAAACPEDKRVEITQCGTDVQCLRFGGEGTGAKSQWDWNDWEPGKSYGFLTVAAPRTDDRVEFTGFFYADELGSWRIIASMIVNRAGKSWSLHGMYSFVEQWTHDEVGDLRWAHFGPAFLRADGSPVNEWTAMTQAAWRHGTSALEDATHVNGNVTESGQNWEMGLGGDLTKETKINALLTVQPQRSCPAPLDIFIGLERSSTLPSAAPPAELVSCGNHAAPTCAGCPQGFGASYCNGECIWQSGQCVPKPEARRLPENCIVIANFSSTTSTSASPSGHNANSTTTKDAVGGLIDGDHHSAICIASLLIVLVRLQLFFE